MEFSTFFLTLTLLCGVVYSQECADEVNCAPTSTTPCPGFECPASRICIPSVWLCDGDNDCGDMSDEEDCPSTSSTQCSGFTCNDAAGACLPYYWQCDGEPDCRHMEDEAGCPCEGFQCPTGFCIPSGWTCDGDNDCGDFSDETEEACPCKDGEERCPPANEGAPGLCIPPEYICDAEGINDCADGSDQANCTNQSGSTTPPNAPQPVGRHERPETVRANSIRRMSKANEKKANEQRHAEKRQSQYYKHRAAKKGIRKQDR